MAEYFKNLYANLTLPIQVFSAVSAALLLAIAGPFDTFVTMSLLQRLVYWSAIVGSSVLIVQIIKTFITLKWPKLGFWKSGVLLAACLAVVFAPVPALLSQWVAGEPRDEIIAAPAMMALIFLVTMSVVVVRFLVTPKQAADFPRLFDRFSSPDVKSVSHVTVRDHYVDVYTNVGKMTLLMRFSDALAELDGIPGLQVHRSHWVGNAAVKGLEKSDGRLFVKMHGGILVPVSRGYRAKVETAFTSATAARPAPVRRS